jgi:hypothetical protein
LTIPDELATRLRAVEELLDKNRNGNLSGEELREWEHYEYIEHLIRLAKARVHQRQGSKMP